MKLTLLFALRFAMVMALLLLFTINSQATKHIVTVQNYFFSPGSVSVNLGDSMEWDWVGGSHTTTSTTIPAGAAAWDHKINSNAANLKFIYVPTVVGTYNYKCTPHEDNGMVGTFTVVCPTPSVTISAGGSTTFCQGGSVLLSASGAFTTYQWKSNGSDIVGATMSSYSATSAGSYTLKVTNSCGNSATSNAIGVTVNSPPAGTITAQGPTEFCKQGTVTLMANEAGLTYQWKKNGSIISAATSVSYVAEASGTFTCDVTNSCGTTPSNSIVVTENPKPTVMVTKGQCSGGAVLLTAIADPNTGVKYKWKKDGASISGATKSTYSATQSGSYKVTVTIIATGCKKTSGAVNVVIDCRIGDIITAATPVIYPNPTEDYFVINTSQLKPGSEIGIYDLTGKLLEIYSAGAGVVNAGNSLPEGVYFARIISNDEVIQVFKLVKGS